MVAKNRRSLKKEIPRIEALRVRNFRVFRNLEMKGLKRVAVLVGPNGSGKSTLFDVFAFLSECFTIGLRKAWDKRGRFKQLRSRGADGPITFEIKYREYPKEPVITYHLSISEDKRGPFVAKEWLRWRRKQRGRPFTFLDFKEGEGRAIPGETPDETAELVDEKLTSRETLAVSTLGQFAKHPRVAH